MTRCFVTDDDGDVGDTKAIFIVLSFVAKPHMRVHSDHLSEIGSAPGGHQLIV